MKLLKVLTLTLALNGILPAHAVSLEDAQIQLQACINIEPINEHRVHSAYEAYTYEAKWAPTIRYIALATLTVAGAYGLYRLLQKNPPLCPETHLYFQNLSPETKLDLVKEAGELILSIKAQSVVLPAITPTKESEWLTEQAKKMASSLSNVASSVANSASSVLSYGAGLTAATTLSNYAHGAILPMIPTIPTSGNLQWYISARTDYDRNMNDLQRYLKNHTLFQDEINDVMKLVVLDVEKIVAYLQHFNAYVSPSLVSNKRARATTVCQRYINNITLITNNLVDELNTEKPMPILIEKFGLLVSEIHSAKIFVSAYHN